MTLSAWIDAGLSLGEIGQLTERHPSTVGYWVAKHGLTANGRTKYAGRGGIDRDRLSRLVGSGRALREIAAELGVSVSTVRYWIGRYGLPSPIEIRRASITRTIAEGRRTLRKECAKHGWTTFVVENSGRIRCRKCRMQAVSAWRRRAKAKLVAEAGGHCVKCGYDRCQAALQFHHLDPTDKAFALSNAGVPRSIEVLRAETAKCALLCANCHAEVESGVAVL